MHNNDTSIENHYNRPQLFETIVRTLEAAGIPKEKITRDNLALVDEFHVRGQEATASLAAQLNLQPGTRVLDLGCGLGGATRFLAGEYGCQVTGIDLTTEYIRTAQLLSQLTNQSAQTAFIQGSALSLPFDDHQFDIVWTQHAQMNIEDKGSFFSEAARVLAPGGRFVYYDVLQQNNQPVLFPVPWAEEASQSFLISSTDLHYQLLHAGLRPVHTTDHSAAGITFLETVLERFEAQGMPPMSIKMLIGDNAIQKLRNLCKNLTAGSIMLESGIYQLLTSK